MKDRFYLEDDKLKQLIIYKTDGGRYAVRPMNWAGAWDEKGRIKESLNHLALFIEKEDAEKFVEWKEAEEQEKLLKLPCTVGDTVYRIEYRYTKCSRFGEEFDESSCCGCESECDSHKEYYIGETKPQLVNWIVEHIKYFGKTIFLTREEAETELEKIVEG